MDYNPDNRIENKSDNTKSISSNQLLKKFHQEISDAQELLNYSISKGLDIDDEIIEGIKEAEEFLNSADLPPKDKRTAFEQKYRDLAHTLSPITATTLRDTSDIHGRKIFLLTRLVYCQIKGKIHMLKNNNLNKIEIYTSKKVYVKILITKIAQLAYMDTN